MGHGLKALALVTIVGVAAPAYAVQFANRSFEQGNLNGWEAVGDVSVQTGAIGSSPTHGEYQALITTLNPAWVWDETPYSGNGSVCGWSWCGTPSYWEDYIPVEQLIGLPYPDLSLVRDDSVYWLSFHAYYSISSVRQDVSLRAGTAVLFDYNFFSVIDYNYDSAWVYVAQASDIGGIYNPLNAVTYLAGCNWVVGDSPCISPPPPASSNIDLCSQENPLSLCDPGNPYHYMAGTEESGWQTFRWTAPADGTYSIFVGINNSGDSLAASGMLLDNFRIRVPEPEPLALLSLGLLGLGVTARRKRH